MKLDTEKTLLLIFLCLATFCAVDFNNKNIDQRKIIDEQREQITKLESDLASCKEVKDHNYDLFIDCNTNR